MDFLLKKGPWKELFQGSMEGHPLEIFTNPDLTILVSLSETEGGKKGRECDAGKRVVGDCEEN